MSEFEKALNVAAYESEKDRFYGNAQEEKEDAFKAGARWARRFTIAEICEWLKTNFETTDKSAANWYAQKIEKHFKDRGGE